MGGLRSGLGDGGFVDYGVLVLRPLVLGFRICGVLQPPKPLLVHCIDQEAIAAECVYGLGGYRFLLALPDAAASDANSGHA